MASSMSRHSSSTDSLRSDQYAATASMAGLSSSAIGRPWNSASAERYSSTAPARSPSSARSRPRSIARSNTWVSRQPSGSRSR